jgi:lipocalin
MGDNSNLFSPEKYLGIWYELMHSPIWFENARNYNTMAEYKPIDDNTIEVVNSTIEDGITYQSKGIGKYQGNMVFQIQFENGFPGTYIIDKLWFEHDCNFGDIEYRISIVTNQDRDYFSVLSRDKAIPLKYYNELMAYVRTNFSNLDIIQVPHYD